MSPWKMSDAWKVRNILSAHRIGSRTDFARVNQGDLTWQGAPGKIGQNVSNPLQLTHNMNLWIHFILTHVTEKLVCTFESSEGCEGRVQYTNILSSETAKTHNVHSMYWSCIISHTSQSITRNSLEDIFGQRWLQKIIGQNEKAPFFSKFFNFIYFIFFLL